jgi:hypothetical protein
MPRRARGATRGTSAIARATGGIRGIASARIGAEHRASGAHSLRPPSTSRASADAPTTLASRARINTEAFSLSARVNEQKGVTDNMAAKKAARKTSKKTSKKKGKKSSKKK